MLCPYGDKVAVIVSAAKQSIAQHRTCRAALLMVCLALRTIPRWIASSLRSSQRQQLPLSWMTKRSRPTNLLDSFFGSEELPSLPLSFSQQRNQIARMHFNISFFIPADCRAVKY